VTEYAKVKTDGECEGLCRRQNIDKAENVSVSVSDTSIWD